MTKRYTTKKAFTWLLKWTLWFGKRRLPTLPHCPIEQGVPSVHGRYGGGDIPYCTKWINEKAFTWLLKWTLCLLKNRLPLFHIAPLNTVYHQCMDSMTVAISHIAQNEQLKKRSLDCSNERFGLKKSGYLLSRIALFDTVYHRCMDSTVTAIYHITQNNN